MILIKTWNTVPFDLELIININDPVNKLNNYEKVHELTKETKRRISEFYPKIELHPSTTITGYYGGEYRGPALHGKTNAETFKEIFGKNIERGFSLLFPPIPIICDMYVKWYQTGDLIVPEILKDVVKRVYIGGSAIGSFTEVNLKIPKNAIKY